MPLAPGTSFGPYEILAPLGAGGMGEVYRARDKRLGRDVAIKVLPSSFAIDPERMVRFDREARLLAALNHPHIGAIHGVEEAEGVRALVLELVEGQTLAERLARGSIQLQEALGTARQIADALEAAHAQGIIHRDLKPANIKVRPDGVVKVLDFGLAKVWAGDGSGADLSELPTMTVGGTREGLILGTPAYMSPEQARGQAVDKRTDIWAFGCVLYEIVTGRAAFRGATVSDTIAAVLEQEPDWGALPESTPPGVRRVLQRCLVKDSRRRLHDIADARIEVEEALGPSTASSAPVVSTGAASPARGRRFRARLAWASALGALTLLGSWVLYTYRFSREPATVRLSVLPPRGMSFPRGSGAWPSVSPDGRRLAFVALKPGGEQSVFVRPLDTTVPRQLVGTDGAMRPFWSPDSRSLAFFANGRLLRVDVDTGAVRVLADAPYTGGLAGDWGDGVIVFKLVGGFRSVPAGGGPSRMVLENANGLDPTTPSFLPDGRHFLFTRYSERPEERQACVGSLDSTETTCILNVDSQVVYAAPGFLLYVRNSALVAQSFDPDSLKVSGEPFSVTNEPIDADPAYAPPPFSISDTGVLAFHSSTDPGRLVWLDRSGAPLGVPPTTGGRPALSPDETRIIAPRRDPQTDNEDLWLIDRSRGTEARFTFDPANDGWPRFSPDGEQVVFSSTRTGRPQLYRKRTSGDGVEEALTAAHGASTDWSSDGRFIVYQASDPKTGFDLWAVSLSGDGKPFPVARTEHGEREGRFSPDVRWVAYDSTESGRRETWIQPFPPTGSKWQISTGGGVSPQWRRDGQELFYVAADGTLTAVPIKLAATPQWGSPQPLFQTMYRGGVYAIYAVSRDGQRFLVGVPPGVEDVTPITVVVNWAAALQK